MATGTPALSSATPLEGAQDAAAVPRAPALTALELSRLLDEFEVERTVHEIEAGDFKRVRAPTRLLRVTEAIRSLFRSRTSCYTRRSRSSARYGNDCRSVASSTSSPTRRTAGASLAILDASSSSQLLRRRGRGEPRRRRSSRSLRPCLPQSVRLRARGFTHTPARRGCRSSTCSGEDRSMSSTRRNRWSRLLAGMSTAGRSRCAATSRTRGRSVRRSRLWSC